jgi:hypothetical protein
MNNKLSNSLTSFLPTLYHIVSICFLWLGSEKIAMKGYLFESIVHDKLMLVIPFAVAFAFIAF